ncbi:MAG TPA: hypothetical protein DCG75_08325 [Bacteroidales bacterium]|nr:hypothetical protein [Bacteroidales bacterium]
MFFAYPNEPKQLCDIIENAVSKINLASQKIKPWKTLHVVGAFIAQKVLQAIDENEVLIADITNLNFNVTYEIGYAIGKGKPIFLLKNKSITELTPSIREVGIFDTIGYKEYSNSDELFDILSEPKCEIIHGDNLNINTKAPVYLLEQKYKTDFAIRITARIKKARYIYRSFDPTESPRLSAYDAINQVSQSFGVVVSLLSKETNDFEIHNIRAAFIAGLANGMNKRITILQHGDTPVPIDYRDFVNVYYSSDDIHDIIADFAGDIAEAFQEGSNFVTAKDTTLLQKLDFGSSSAENEMRFLQEYYLKTDAYRKALRGEIQLVVGRKGSGKTAIFLQIRDKERSSKKNVVLDLKPESYKLIKFKELVLDFLKEGTFQHTILAFWEYILLLEICHKVLVNDKNVHMITPGLYEPYSKLETSYKSEYYLTEGDFSERMSQLMENLTTSFNIKYGSNKNITLSVPEITELLYKTNLFVLKQNLFDYLKHKNKVWLLFDNIDKGWPSSGLQHEDLIIVRTLIDATRKIQRDFGKRNLDVFPIVFLRNDIYELLVKETSDRQKEAKELLDWTDPDLLREIIKLRIISSLDLEDSSFEEIWRKIIISHYNGEETSQYLIERSLMRPRFLINLINQCKSFAVNLNHTKIEKEDIEKGLQAYSSDLLTDIDYEMKDILPEIGDLLYKFISVKPILNETEIDVILSENKDDSIDKEKFIDLLLWYGFLGIKNGNEETKYIYTLNYNMKLFKGYIQKHKSNFVYIINPSFWPALMIEG